MPLARTFLRLTALEALRPTALLSAGNPAWPTLAGALVFDSRVDPIDDLAALQRAPIVVVYTDQHNFDPLDRSGPFPYTSVVDLVFEISVVAQVEDPQAPGEIVPGLPVSDAEMEASLDLLEAQIYFALHFALSGALFRKVCKFPFRDWNSVPHRTSEENARLAMRTIRAQVPLRETCHVAAPLQDLTGLDRLPRPLNEIADALAQSSYGKPLIAALSGQAPAMPAADRLDAVALGIRLSDPPAEYDADGATAVAASAENMDSS